MGAARNGNVRKQSREAEDARRGQQESKAKGKKPDVPKSRRQRLGGTYGAAVLQRSFPGF